MSALIAPAPASAGSTGGSSSSSTPSSSGGSTGASSSSSAGLPDGVTKAPGGQQRVDGAPGTVPNASPDARPGETPEQTIRRLKRVEKVNGKEVELEATEDELWAAKRHQAAVHDNARRVAEERKRLAQEREEFLAEQRRLAEDPFHLHRKQDPNFDEHEFLTRRLHGLLQEQGMSPVERENLRLRQELEQRTRAEQERTQRLEQERIQAEENRTLSQLGANFVKALKEAKLPTSDFWLDQMAKAYFTAEDEQDLQLSPQELARETKTQTVGALDALAADETLTDDEVLDLAPNWSKRIHRALVARFKKQQGGTAPQPVQPSTPPATPAPKEQERLTDREAWRKMEEERGRRSLRTI